MSFGSGLTLLSVLGKMLRLVEEEADFSRFPLFHYFRSTWLIDSLSVWAKSFFYLPDLMSSSRKFSKSSRPKWRMFKKCLRSFLPWTGQGRKVLFSILAKDTKSCEWLLWFNDNIHILNVFMKSYIGSEEEKYEKNEELIKSRDTVALALPTWHDKYVWVWSGFHV